jgi:DNA-binding MarR family transcriptional regulator
MLLRKAYLSFHRRANAWMLNHGITADQFVLLTVVAREPGITQITIVERTASDPNTVAAILRLLERRRLVRREAHARDRRARCVFPTAEGRRVQRRAARDAGPILAALGDCLADCDRGQIERFLRRVHHAFTAPPAEVNGRPPRRPSPRKGTA